MFLPLFDISLKLSLFTCASAARKNTARKKLLGNFHSYEDKQTFLHDKIKSMVNNSSVIVPIQCKCFHGL